MLEQTQMKAKRGFWLLESKGEAVYFRCGDYISPARQISLTDGVCAECAVEPCEVWSEVGEEAQN